MSTTRLHSLKEEKTDTQKQLGCMNAIFQLFDRHNFLLGRQATSHNHKRLPPGQNVTHGMEQHGTMEKMQVGKEKKLVAPVELSRTSISSSCSSSTFSSVDCSITAQSEPSSSCQSSFPETTLALPLQQPRSSSQLSRQSLDLRDIVKDSMYKEARGLSVKITTKEEGRGHTIKHIDSPRPLQQHKYVQPKVMRHDGSLQVLAKLRDGPWNAKEEKYGSLPFAPRDSPRYSYDERGSQDKLKSTAAPRDSPRYSYDERGSQDKLKSTAAPRDSPRYSYDERGSQDKLKSTAKLKELPRLSLDSRERSRRNSASELKLNHLSREIEGETRISSQILNLNQEPGSNKRPSTIVARLMGLEAIPDFFPTDEGQMMKSCLDEDADMISRSTRVYDESSQNKVSGAPSISYKNLASPRLRNDNTVKKSTSSSMFLLEPAPWRQTDSNRGSQRRALKYREASNKSPHASPSVYGAIEKRLTELEFKKSGKDLRALKRILEAMEKTRERLENKKAEQTPNSESHTRKCSPYTSFDQAYTQQRPSNNPVSPIIKGSSSPPKCGSQVVIVKAAKLTGKPVITTDGKSGLHKMWSGDGADNIKDLLCRQTAKDITPRKNYLTESSSWPQHVRNKKTNVETLRSSRYLKVPQQLRGENPASFQRSSGALSPRMQEKKHGMEKPSSLSTQSSDLRRARKQSIQQPIELGSPRRKLKLKSTDSQHGNDQISCSTSEARTLNHQGDTVSMQSESGKSLASQIDMEVTSTDHTREITSPYQLKDPTEEDFTARFTEDRLIAELATKPRLEQPSPVSVLDTTFYDEDDFPSPVKKTSTAFQDYDTLSSDEAEWNAVYIDNLHNSRRTNLSSKFNHRKLGNIDHLVHKLRLVNSTKDEAAGNHIESLCDNTNPDHRYIVDILLAAGLLTDLGSSLTTIQLHPPGISVHPNLFHVLEKARAKTELADKHHEKSARSKPSKKVQRKLVFDAVNEILFQNKMGEKCMSGEELLKELYSKMDHHQAIPDASLDDEDDGLTSILRADMMNQPQNWIDYSSELPGIVLDIERLIFKDLIGEVVSGGAAGLHMQPGRHCMQLFST